MENELKPCPFCGENAEIRFFNNGPSFSYRVECLNCTAMVGRRVAEYSTNRTFWFNTKREAIAAWNQRAVDGETSDGYHTFNELYHHRAVLFSKVVEFAGKRAWKSKLHADGTMFDGFFIVGVETPEGQATYHYAIDQYWEMFDCKEVEHAPVWDGHTPQEAIARIEHWNQRTERTCNMTWHYSDNGGSAYTCSNCGRDTYPFHKSFEYCPHCTAKVVE